jgi:hypothetical protein
LIAPGGERLVATATVEILVRWWRRVPMRRRVVL